MLDPELVRRVRAAIRPERLVETAVRLVEVPSPTRSGGAVADRLAQMLAADGFSVERPVAGWPQAPAVATRYATGRPGRTLQFNGHLDTVHLPFVPPRVENGILYGSGAADMKGGTAAALEALRAIRDTQCLPAGSVLFTAHDLHEMPWGDGSQVDHLIAEGYLGDGVLIPEYMVDCIPVAGRGQAVLEITVSRDGSPVHEVMGGIDGPNVIAVGTDVVRRLLEHDRRISVRRHPVAGRESVFVGQVHSGEIYNQSPVEFRMSGTRRWLPGARIAEVEAEYRALLDEAAAPGVRIEGKFIVARDAFELNPAHPLIEAFQSVHETVSGARLPFGSKPFVDDGNTFVARGRVPAITHGPRATGAHTLNEQAPIEELVRVALEYALTAVVFCGATDG